MIPRRIKLSGFLCYKDEQTVSFADSPLWMLTGANGSGKSSIFDAVTYALFGYHRGGKAHAEELINKDSKAFSVEFDFLSDGQVFRILRTQRRDARGGSKGTQLISRLDPATGKPAPILDTNLSKGFDNWIKDKIGLSYATFTSSVLLLQGQAEKLLGATPKDRADVLAGIVDLERYQKIHEKADTRRKDIKREVETIDAKLTGIPDVTDFEMLAAESKIIEAEQAKETAAAEVEKLQNLEFDARRWADMHARRDGLLERWKKADSLVKESTSIENAYRRLKELRDVIPHLLTIQEKQRAIEESNRTSKQLAQLKDDSVAELRQIESDITVVQKKKEACRISLMQEEQKLEQVRARQRELAGPLLQLGLFEEQSERIKRIDADLKRLPKKLTEDLAEAQQTFDHRVELGKVVPLLDRFASARITLRRATTKASELEKAEGETRRLGEQAKQTHADAKVKLDQAVQARQQADEAATEARTVFQQAKSAAKEFENLEGARVCRACGQKLTAAHWKTEKKARDQAVEEAHTRHTKAVSAQKVATSAETSARDQCTAAEHDLQKLREAYRDTSSELNREREEIEKQIEACRIEYQALPREYRERISTTPPADWLATTWPSADEQQRLKTEAGELASVSVNVQELRDQLSKQSSLQAERRAASDTIASLGDVLNADPATLRKEETSLKTEETAYANKLKGTKKLIQENETELEKLNKKLADAQKTLANLDSQLNVEEATRTQHQDAIDRASKMLSPSWQEAASKAGLAEQNRWKTELETLNNQGTEAKYQELATSRASLESLKQDITLVEEEAQKIREEARRPVEEIKALFAAARKTVEARNEEMQTRREEKAVLDRRREDHKKLTENKLALDKELSHFVTLAQLLGRDRLQRHLVRTAEKQIVDFANSILDRLSSGQLYLRLCGGDEGTIAERALDLEAFNRITGSTPINVNFLSGSQRFRVAVSLALAIGQYASRQHRPIESVIIDEGFGCLDRNGRQVMIQELQNLRGQLQCILLVSHQEEFADAFTDGYHFELVDGATRVTRIQK